MRVANTELLKENRDTYLAHRPAVQNDQLCLNNYNKVKGEQCDVSGPLQGSIISLWRVNYSGRGKKGKRRAKKEGRVEEWSCGCVGRSITEVLRTTAQ